MGLSVVQRPVDALSFELAGSRHALLAEWVHEVVRAVAIEQLPHAPSVIAGVINLRGQVIPVVDMRRRLGLTSKPVAPEDNFVIVQANDWRLALHVDRALDLMAVVPLPLAEVSPGDGRGSYIAGVVPTEDGVLLIQDLPAFLSHDESSTLQLAMQQREAEPRSGP